MLTRPETGLLILAFGGWVIALICLLGLGQLDERVTRLEQRKS